MKVDFIGIGIELWMSVRIVYAQQIVFESHVASITIPIPISISIIRPTYGLTTPRVFGKVVQVKKQ
jgi:hypothetical protein